MTITSRIFSNLTVLLTPLLLLLIAVQILLTPLFFEIEYRMPGFPEDTYGFTFEERMHWAKSTMHYLKSNEGIDYLSGLAFEDGNPIYVERELDHMIDVKNLIIAATYGLFALLLLMLLSLLYFKKSEQMLLFWRAISRGGVLTIGLILSALLTIFIGFDALFTGFHKIFFEGDSWLFYFSDTLIRLFPMRLWQDAFATAGIFTFLGGAALFFTGSKKTKSI
ncbi:MAG: TIGR01906 family membrane protein [Anaerolineaceae bacterium]|nr:TIGR01906 family membrane protein [Anaerolineaceae bacterium]